ncbi:aldehyde dehydrogenase family protein [Rhodococcus sp. NPDC057529]|uniref:aldehyde dehydrogenase family protein n=1 Tax=Rhodococcus sp. NPDC057529 TaxID=3346158 RepID=UPI00366E1FCE
MSEVCLYRVLNPATGTVEAEYPTATDAEVSAAVERADRAYRQWSQTPPAERRRVLAAAADLFEKRADDLGTIITREMGKLTRAATGEATFSGEILRFYADRGEQLLADQQLDRAAGGTVVVQKRSIGTIFGVMPWNYPYYQAIRFAAPNLLLGNTILLKHAPSCPESALAIGQIFTDAGLPDGAFQSIFASNAQSASIIGDDRIHGVSLTGSERAGGAVGETAGRHLKKVVLELGGSDAVIIRPDADPLTTAEAVVTSRLANSGQACNSPKRILVAAEIFDRFLDRVVEFVRGIAPGDPSDESTMLAPMASHEAARALRAQVLDAVHQGATVHAGDPDAIIGAAGYGPVVMSGITPAMRAYREELFGPVIALYRVDDDAEAVRLANDTAFGLGATIFTADHTAATALAEHLQVGMVNINRIPDSAPDVPFGGIKKSGFGRELGALGVDEFANKKVLWSADS